MTMRASHARSVILAFLTTLAMVSVSPSIAAAECPNEQLRRESTTNPATGQPYSLGLPDCRAYEMVSPLVKNGSDIKTRGEGIPAAANGDAVGFFSANAFADAENNQIGGLESTGNSYIARRMPSAWTTSSALAPARLVGNSDYHAQPDGSPGDLSSTVDCGVTIVTNDRDGTNALCALRRNDGTWLSTPPFPNSTGGIFGGHDTGLSVTYLGASIDLSRVFFESDSGREANGQFVAADSSSSGGDGLYEVAGVGGVAPELRLVNVDNSGNEIGPKMGTRLGGLAASSSCAALSQYQSSYQAISNDGGTIYFTACPSDETGGVDVVYARINGTSTVAVSNPSPAQCTSCSPAAASATYQGASADGSKVFFTTTQQLVNGDTDTSNDLYEYDFKNPLGQNLIQVSGGGPGDLSPGTGANVQGSVVSVSSDGSHVYFVARGVLTTLPNSQGEDAQVGAENLYAWERDKATPQGQTRFVGLLCDGSGLSGTVTTTSCPAAPTSGDSALWGGEKSPAQTTSDGRYLVFTTYARLIATGTEADTDEAADVYRYDSETGQLIRASVGEPSFPASDNGNTPGMDAQVATAPIAGTGAMASINDWSRAISENGAYVIFTTAERLQADDTNTGATPSCSFPISNATGCDVYEWHEGAVSMVSPGNDPASVSTTAAAMSASGSDIFLLTRTQLVGQDTDQLIDVYDARIDGGFPAPRPEPSCSGESCQGSQSAPPAFGAVASASFAGGGNLIPGPTSFPPPGEAKPKSLSRAQKLARALKVCRRGGKSKAKRAACERAARRKYIAKPRAKKATKVGAR
jgi:hypothetical protein